MYFNDKALYVLGSLRQIREIPLFDVLITTLDSSFIVFLSYTKVVKIKGIMKLELGLILCWLSIHRYKVVDVSFGFGPSGSIKTIQCKICGIKKTKRG